MVDIDTVVGVSKWVSGRGVSWEVVHVEEQVVFRERKNGADGQRKVENGEI